MRTYDVYILLCSDNSYYIGITGNLESRLYQHHHGVYTSCYTYARRPLRLVYVASFHDIWQAISWEKRVKRWRRAKKEALIQGAYENLPLLSSNKCMRIAMVRQAHHDNALDILGGFSSL